MDFEIYFSDLTEEAQRRLLDAFGITDAKEANWDAFPVIVLPIADD